MINNTMSSVQHIIGRNEGKKRIGDHEQNMIDYPHLTFTDSPEFPEIRKNWNKVLEP
jgi:hypothetical protein